MGEHSAKYRERVQLFNDTIACKKTSRICAAPEIMYLPIFMYGKTTVQDVMKDFGAAEESFIRYHEEFQPDQAWGPLTIFPSPALETLGCNYVNWPGKQLADPNAPFQVVDREEGYMSPDEYLEYAEDPTGFMMRKVLPRQYSALKGLEMIDWSNALWVGALYGMIPCAFPPVQGAFRAMEKAGQEMLQAAESAGRILARLEEMGFPPAFENAAQPPFDVFNDTLRGFMNTTMDMIEYPDELLAAIEASTKVMVRNIRHTYERNPQSRSCHFFVHNGFDMFMSREQFETFYWPGFKKCIDTIVECGGIPHLVLEDNYESKLDILARDLPAGKCIVKLVNTDPEKAKKAFAGKVCIAGGIDAVLLAYGTKDEVARHVKETIKVWGEANGYFLETDMSLDNAKPENLQVMFDVAKNYCS